MSEPGAPRLLDALVRRLLPGSLGDEARREMERGYRGVHERRGRLVATLWYLGYLGHPHTWALAFALRRARRRVGRAARGRAGDGVGTRGGSPFSWLDLKLGVRMLARYPVMTAVSGLAISVTIAVAVATFALFQDFLLRPEVPLPEPDRVVSLGLKNVETRRNERRLLHELEAWRASLTSVEHVGLWRQESRTLLGGDGTTDLVRTALMSASGFDVARIPPLLGRPLLPADEIPGAPPVVVIGHEPWSTRFDAAADVVGRSVVLGGEPHTIVGVMPEGFGFPYAESFWLPLLDDPDAWAPLEGPVGYYAFGRLASGATLARADAEVNAVARRRAAELPESHEHLAARVMAFTDAYTGMDDVDWLIWLHRLILGLITLVVLIPFSNVVILVYARTATRIGEIAVRSGLGASRGRIVAQLLAEALVVALPAALLGIVAALVALEHVDRLVGVYFGGGLPFWARGGRDPWALAYAGGLAVFAAALAAVIPGLQATGRRAHDHLKAAGGGHGMRLGPIWTGLVVVQVAVTVAGLPLAGWVVWDAAGFRMARPTYPAGDFLGVSVSAGSPGVMGAHAAEADARRLAEVVRRLEALPGVRGVHASDRSPAEVASVAFSSFLRLDIDGIGPAESGRGHRVVDMAVDPGFFAFLGVPVLAGRELEPGDALAAAPPVLVSRAFVEHTLGGANAVGRLVRTYRSPGREPAPRREIVGVVEDLLRNPFRPEGDEGMVFVPLDPTRTAAAHLVVRAPGLPPALATEVQRAAAAVDPSIRVDWVAPLADPRDPIRTLMGGVAVVIVLVLASVLFLSAAGVFSLISFNVTRRRREIGIRAALGARPRRVLAGVMGRSIRQLGYGVALGALVAAAVPPMSLDGKLIRRDPAVLVLVAGVLVAMGLVAAWGPARDGLRMQPVDALREG